MGNSLTQARNMPGEENAAQLAHAKRFVPLSLVTSFQYAIKRRFEIRLKSFVFLVMSEASARIS